MPRGVGARAVIIRVGIPVSPGVAIERAFVLEAEDTHIAERFIPPEAVEGALARLERALERARADVREMRERYAEVLGDETAQIFRFHELMLQDRSLLDEIRRHVRERHYSPEYAVSTAFRSRIRMIRSLHDEYLRQRDVDLYDVERRVLRALRGTRQEELQSATGEVVLVAHDLTPSQTATLDTSKIIGFATDVGGRTSHTAIVARALGIPAVVGLGSLTTEVTSGDLVIIDGTKGRVIVNPDEDTLRTYRARRRQFIEFARDLAELRDLPAETRDGHKVTILANIEFPEEIGAALDSGAEGIGLYRTEFLYADGKEPDEEAHFQAYHAAVEACDGRPLVIRTLDLGADKMTDSIVQLEKNPFLGCRSIRYAFQRPELFKTQLRAILRASAFGPIKLMLPMVTTLGEVRRAKLMISDVMDDLEREGIPFDDRIPVGIMVEVPSAALIADFLAREVAFFSIGTNDLVQYTLAVDRVNERVAELYQPSHPAILRLILGVIEAGWRHGIEVSMCGEMSGEVVYTIPLIGLGLRTFSISPGTIPEVKKVTRSITVREAEEVVDRIFTFSDARQTESYLQERARRIVPQLF
ncbi:MAG: phosphoenolpyruvate--protein phosphotransferase [Planctomycetota bacterium]|nr:MAG: phosphoenolpyruvate--protein phosphotransferase [Planctomycetota bacterium]